MVNTAVVYKQKNPSLTYVDLVPKVAVPSLEEEILRIRALGVPGDGSSKVEAFLSALKRGVAMIKEEPKDLLDPQKNPFTKAKAIAASYGLEACSTFP